MFVLNNMILLTAVFGTAFVLLINMNMTSKSVGKLESRINSNLLVIENKKK